MPNPHQSWYGSRRWKAMRHRQLFAEPLCAYCKKAGRDTPANIADHVKPHKGNEALFWDEGNLQSLCKPCHDRDKQVEERGGKPKPRYGKDGWPIDE